MADKTPGVRNRVMLIGLDGATFYLLKPWMEDGTLPNLASLMKESSSSELESTVPCTTPPAWSSCVTGKNPGKHGIYDFRESAHLDPRRPLITASSVKARKIWHILNKKGCKVVVINVPITFPPEPVDGVMISGLMTPSRDSDFTYPASLKEELSNRVGDYVPNIDIPRYDVELKADAIGFLDELSYSFRKRADVFFYLKNNKPWEFLMTVFIVPDRIQHLFWKYIDPACSLHDTRMGEFIRTRVKACFKEMDTFFGRLMNELSDDTALLVMSDHGFGSTHAWINMNTYLEKLGLLRLRGSEKIKKQIFFQAVLANDSAFVKRVVPKSIQGVLRRKVRGTRSTFKSDIEASLDWQLTRAFFPSIPAQGIFINTGSGNRVGTVQPGKEYDDLRAKLREALQALTEPDSGEALMDWVKYREELYSGPQAKYAPDIVFCARNYSYLARQHFGDPRIIRLSEHTPNGFHRPEGIFIARGKEIKEGHEFSGADIMDLAPTVLYLMGYPVPDDMDGKVLTEIFKEHIVQDYPVHTESADAFTEDSRRDYTDEEEEKIRKRLKALGYIE